MSDLTENIRATIGTEYELLVWDNRVEGKGICEVYNLMAARAKFSYICFLHEDIIFTTMNWGGILTDLFARRPEAGVVGIAGGKYKSRMYAGWYSGRRDLDLINVTHRINGKDERIYGAGPEGLQEQQVVCVDGVLIACRREVWKEMPFNEALLKGFHFYDIDFSLRASMEYEVWVTLQIDLIHITKGGDYGDRWVKEAMIFHDSLGDLLPRFVEGAVRPEEIAGIEKGTAAMWLDWLKAHKISAGNKRKWLLRQRLYRWPSLWYRIVVFILYQPLGLRRLHKKALRRNYKAS